MFKEKTLFILGAGSSFPYGYPLGKDLIDEIIQNIEHDAILLPQLDAISAKYNWNENNGQVSKGILENPYYFDDFKNHLENNVFIRFFENPPKRTRLGADDIEIFIQHDNDTGYVKVKLYKIKEFFEFKQALIDFDPVSIDSFLRDNPKYEEIGKIMIIYSLLKHEDISKFSLKNSQSDEEKKKADNWYSYFINDIFSGCTTPQELLNNQLDIITFNYDMSLDYYLYNRISQTELFQQDNIAYQFIERLRNNHITHVYGQLYEDDVQTAYGIFASQSKEISGSNSRYPDMCRFLKALQSKGNIKLINPRCNTQKEIISNKIEQAKEIIIIGFGFDRDNLSILGFPTKKEKYLNFLNGKTIKYMDYNGRMNSLSDQFDAIKKLTQGLREARDFSITRSKATKIIDAYQNDFKIYLY